MTRTRLNELYFEWLCSLVENEEYSGGQSYTELFRYLHETEFIYSIPMDANRFEDGVDLRYRFAYECGHDNRMIASYLDDKPCSVFEMMTALSLKCEEHIMYDPDKGGFFTIDNCSCDLRTVDIWRQMCWYLERRKQNG